MARLDIEKIENAKVRRHWDENSGQYFFSIVDIIGIVTNSSDARNYWKVLKNRLKNTQKELVTNCNQLKMKASDGKFYLTDTADSVTLLQIIKLVSKEDVRVFDRWFEQKEDEKRRIGLEEDGSLLTDDKTKNSPNLPTGESYPQPGAELLVDAFQTDRDIYIRAFVAGVLEKNLSVSATCNEVTIKGKRESNKENAFDLIFHEQELYWGNFSRTISLPDEIDIEKAEVRNSHGVLEIKLLKINKALQKNIEIEFL